jgi:hypothetical protein
MCRLQVLGLSNNRLESLPDSLGHLPALVKLDISTNNLRHLPPSLGKLRRIQRIDAANNMLVRALVPPGWLAGPAAMPPAALPHIPLTDQPAAAAYYAISL